MPNHLTKVIIAVRLPMAKEKKNHTGLMLALVSNFSIIFARESLFHLQKLHVLAQWFSTGLHSLHNL